MPNMPSLDADWRQLVTGGVEAAVMTALLSDAPGKADSLRVGTMPRPTPGAGQVRLKVAVAGLNFPDALIIEDRYQIRPPRPFRSEEHTSELQSLMRISYAVFCLKKKKKT